MVIKRLDVFLVELDPTRGTEIRKTRPCLVVSPDEINRYLKSAIVAPMTTAGRSFPTRVACTFQGKKGQIVVDQIRTIDRDRLVRRLGRIDHRTGAKVLGLLCEMFAP